MGITEGKDLVHSKFLKYPLEHIRTRHILLDRMGIFRTPDKHKIRSAKNPHLGMMIDSSDRYGYVQMIVDLQNRSYLHNWDIFFENGVKTQEFTCTGNTFELFYFYLHKTIQPAFVPVKPL